METPPQEELCEGAKAIIKRHIIDSDELNGSFKRLCDTTPELGAAGTLLRRKAQVFRQNYLTRSPEGNVAKRIRKLNRATKMSKDIILTENWAVNSETTDCFTLDPDHVWNNMTITPIIVPNVYDNGEWVDKLHIELRVTDIEDLLDGKYKAKLERDGKGIFIWMPRIPKFFYQQVGKLYVGEVGDNPDFAAHSVQALKLAEDETLQTRVVYYKFPGDMTCDNSHFNEKLNTGDLQLKMSPSVNRKLPDQLSTQKGIPKVQFIPGVCWDCVIADSVQQVTKKKEENSVIDLLLGAGFANMTLQGKDSSSDDDDDDEEM